MSRAVGFHLDEHISSHIAAGLRRRHIRVTMTADAQMSGSSDEQQLAYATATNLVIVTHDADFLRLHATGVDHTEIIYCQQGTLTVGQLLQRLILIHDVLTIEEMKNHVEFL